MNKLTTQQISNSLDFIHTSFNDCQIDDAIEHFRLIVLDEDEWLYNYCTDVLRPYVSGIKDLSMRAQMYLQDGEAMARNHLDDCDESTVENVYDIFDDMYNAVSE